MRDHPLPLSVFVRDAFQTAVALEAYEAASARLCERCGDPPLYEEVGRLIDSIRQTALPVPGLTVPALKLVIADAELIATVWRHASVGVAPETLQDVRERHAAAVDALRKAVLRLQACF